MSPILINLIVAIVVAVITALLGLYIQPLITIKQHKEVETWNKKRDVYIEALSVVDKYFASLDWKMDSPEVTQGAPPTHEAVNNTYSKLILFAKDMDIPKQFIVCVGDGRPENGIKNVKLEYKSKLIELMRRDLKLNKVEIGKDLSYFVPKKKSENNDPL